LDLSTKDEVKFPSLISLVKNDLICPLFEDREARGKVLKGFVAEPAEEADLAQFGDADAIRRRYGGRAGLHGGLDENSGLGAAIVGEVFRKNDARACRTRVVLDLDHVPSEDLVKHLRAFVAKGGDGLHASHPRLAAVLFESLVEQAADAAAAMVRMD